MTLNVAVETLVAMGALTLVGGLGIVAGHVLWRRHRDRHRAETESLALDFARHLMGRLSVGELQDRAGRSRATVFWSALEAITENIEGEEWSRLSAALLGLAPVTLEERRLASREAWRRALAARRLGMLDASSLHGPIRSAMTRGPETVLLPAALALARAHDLTTLDWLLRHPGRTAHLGRHILVVLLKRFGPKAPPALRRALRRRRPDGLPIELAALDVLGLWKDRRSRVLLEGLSAHPDIEVRVSVTRALGRIAVPRSVPVLLRALDDVFWQVRAQAARVLGEMEAMEALLPLTRLAGDSSWWVRRRAAYALGAMGEEGRRALTQIEHGSDRYAADFAVEVQQALEWERERPGGIDRVD